jgi:Suppressor of fused protein (SUFU)
MFEFLKRWFQRTPPAAPAEDDESSQRWYDHKSKLLEQSLGKEHDMVMHAIIPYAIGGALDLYYYPNGIPGTGIATKELSELPDQGSSNASFQTYELVMFTRHRLNLDEAKDEKSPFGAAHSNINAILNLIARYSESASLNPGETCEFPKEMEGVGGKCLIFDSYGLHNDELSTNFGLLLIIEVFRSEMDYARENGGAALLHRLKNAGHYPYSDLDREAVA